MPDQPDDIARLRNAHYAFEELPDTITFAQQPGSSCNRDPLPIADATIDDIAIAIVAADEAASEFRRRIFALQHLYKSAREMGCIGTDAWVNWPARAAALMAAELSASCGDATGQQITVEPAVMQKVLERHVRAHLDELAEVRPDFR